MPSITTNQELTDAIIDWFRVNGADQANESTTAGDYAIYYGPISNWQITNGVTSMASAFDKLNGDYNGTAAATGIPTFNKNIGAWNTNGVKNMGSMFNGAALFNNGGQALAFNTGEVTSMRAMFQGAAAFKQSLGNNFTTSKVRDMSYMFYGAALFNNGGQALAFNTSEVTTMYAMFAGAAAFNQSLGDKFDTSQVTDMSYMFKNAQKFTGYGLANWRLTKRPTISNMFINSLVPTNENNTAIWYTWQDGYGYQDPALQGAGLLKRDRPNTNFAPLIGEGVSTAVTTGVNGLTEGLKKIATILLTDARGALIGVGG